MTAASMCSLGNILVADDDAACLSLTTSPLQQAGYDCDSVPDAPQAAQKLATKQYDLLVSDLEMPGNEDLRLMRDVPQMAAGLPIIIMTAYPTVETAVQSIQLPVAAYLVKPFNKAELLAQVERAVQRYQACRVVQANHRRVEEWNRALRDLARCWREKGVKSSKVFSVTAVTGEEVGPAMELGCFVGQAQSLSTINSTGAW